ncbi:MAG: ribonuclease D [Clostridiales Family XIII bacterium]|jgi:ribonuclease D|nr:ribonuclease D [Clostridiales Family XIII bacterium]
MYIKTKEQLQTFANDIKNTRYLAVDTEFLSNTAYYSKLCLLQLATEDICAIVDPIAIGDIRALAPIFADKSILKIFHSGNQDCSILYHALGVVPAPIFDTQVAGLVLGYATPVSLATIVEDYCGVILGKTETCSHWDRRPLTKSQKEYALDDVRYLISIYKDMSTKLDMLGRASWLAPSFEEMGLEETYTIDPYERWQKVKYLGHLGPRSMAVLREVAAWREIKAQKQNKVRKKIMSDSLLVKISKRAPKNFQELYRIRGIDGVISVQDGQEILDAVAATFAIPEKELPHDVRAENKEKGDSATVELVSALLHERARENQVASMFIATRDDLDALICGRQEDLSLLDGWRREIVGAELLDLLAGKISITIRENKIEVNRAS